MIRMFYFSISLHNKTYLMQVSKKAISQSGKSVLEASDQLDDGSPITLRVELDPECGAALFDFTGTSPQVRATSCVTCQLSTNHERDFLCHVHVIIQLERQLQATQ